MNINEKLDKLTPEQRKKLYTLEDSTELEVFLTETGLDLNTEEKAALLEFVKNAKTPCKNDDLELVAGGFASTGSTEEESHFY